jgi:hypothetical protein
MDEPKNIQIVKTFDLINIDTINNNHEVNNRSITNNDFYISISNEGFRGVAGSLSNKGLYYTINGGKNWIESETNKTGTFNCVAINSNGTKAIAGSGTSNGIWYTINSGRTWIQSTLSNGTSFSLLTGKFNCIVINSQGTNCIAGSGDDKGIFYSINGGISWQVSSFNNNSLKSIAINSNGNISFAVSNNIINSKLYSFDSGKTWIKSNIVEKKNQSENTQLNIRFLSTNFNTIAISFSGSNLIGGSSENTGLWYSTNGGMNWDESNNTLGDFYTVCISSNGTRAIAADTNNGLWYSSNSGMSWTKQNINSTFVNLSTLSINFSISSLWYRSISNYKTDTISKWTVPFNIDEFIRTYSNSSGDFFPVSNIANELRTSVEMIQMLVYNTGKMVDIGGEKKIDMKVLFLLL